MPSKISCFATIIPLLRLTPELGAFDYIVPDFLEKQIQIGQVVYIPFRHQIVLGIIQNISNRPPDISQSLKPIHRLYQPTMILSKTYLDFLQTAATYYHVSPSLLAYTVIPKFPKHIKKSFHKKNTLSQKLIIKKERLHDLKTVSEQLNTASKTLLIYQLEQEILSLLFKEIQNTLKQRKKVLFLVPYVTDIYRLLPFFTQYVQGNIYPLHKQMSQGEFFHIWNEIVQQKADVVIATRLGIFSPLDDIGLVIIHNEEYIDFKQYEMNPRYDARTLAHMKKEARVLFTSQAPRTTTFSQMQTIEIPRIGKDTIVIDLSAQKRQKNYSLLTDPVIDALSEHPIAFLYLNKKGIDQGTFCKDCRYIFHCPSCQTTLKKEVNTLFCPKCFEKFPVPMPCPHCHGQNLISLGSGTKKIQSELKKLFPDRPIFRLDKEGDVLPTPLPKRALLIGTEFAIKNLWHLIAPHVSLMCALELDMPGALFDYRYSEKQFATILHLLNLAIASQSQLLIQSHHIHNEILQQALQQNLHNFYQKEIAHRKMLDYPPFAHLCKIICKDTDKSTQEIQIQTIIHELTLEDKNGTYEYIGDYELPATKKFLRHAIIFKTADILQPFPKLPEHYQLDIDYETV